jgi:glycine/D-amino acid oxidase-like deaminating enzyme
VIGAGLTGLWTALALTDTAPGLRVAVLEAESVAFGASGRNGGFCEASLTHGLANGIRHFPDELEILEREGIDNLRGLIAFTRDHAIDCDLEETGTLTVADQPHQVDELRAWADEAAGYGEELELMDRAAVRPGPLPAFPAGLTGRRVATSCRPVKLCRALARGRERGVPSTSTPGSSASSAWPAASASRPRAARWSALTRS